MTILNKILSDREHVACATKTGTETHHLLQRVIIDGDTCVGNTDLVSKIKNNPELLAFFTKESKTEVPIAGFISGCFISRRIDRLVIDTTAQTIMILDYKTDINKEQFYSKYIAQIREYTTLLRAMYPDYVITGYILWTHDFSLEKLPV